MSKKITSELLEAAIIRQKIDTNGCGGIEIDLGKVRRKYAGHRMSAYRNYLGGGLLGRVLGDCTLKGTNDATLSEIMDKLKRLFHEMTNPDTEWEGMTYEQSQRMPASAY